MAKNSIKDYFSIFPIVQDQTREPNEEPEDLSDSRKTADEASTVTNLPRETLASSTHAYGPQYPDVFCENRSVSTLTEAEKISLLIGKWDSEDLCKYKFPLRNISGYNRRLNPKVMKQASWLRYSPSADSVYCGYCYSFGVQAFRTSDWSNISKFVDRHVGENASHHTAVARGQAFIDVHRGAPDIRQQLQNQRVQAIEENRAILKSITEVVVTMARQNISLRGHVPEESNFNSLMALVAQHNSTLRHHLENVRGNAKYTSPEIQNELLDLSAQLIVNNIASDCKKAGCYAFIADESTDVSVKEQISVCVRFVQKGNNGRHIIREEFLSFVDADKGTNAEALTTKFLEALNNLGLPLDQMRAQGYDGASVMSGHINGVQARIQRQNPKAAYIHCRAQVLNLCIVHSSKLPLIRNIMDTMQEVSLAFKFSAKRFLVFQEQLRQNADVREEMGRQSKLKVLCETRWASRADCLNVFVTSFQVIVDTLNELSESGDNKARGLHSSILKWDFIVTAVILQHIFECTHRLSVYLQSTELDLVQASKEAKVCSTVFQVERNDDAVWDALVDKAADIAAFHNIDPSIPRRAGRQQHRENVEADTPSAYWRRAVYFPFLDHLVSELNELLVKPLPGFQAQYLIPGKLQDLSEKCVEDIYNYYGDEMHMTLDEFKREVTRWRHRWPITEDDPPQTLVETLDFADPELYPRIYVAVKTLLTYPVSTCVAERSFSSMKRLKTPLRNTTSEDRLSWLSSLSVLHIHKHKELDVNEVISEFARRKNRRLALCL